jgi:hypothetical protein
MLAKLLLLPAAMVAMIGIAACDDGDDDDDLINGDDTPGQTATIGSGETPGGDGTNTPGNGGETTTPANGGDDERTVQLEGQGTDGAEGEAVLSSSSTGTGTMVTVTFDDDSVDGTVAIHEGSCDDWEDTAVGTVGTISNGMASGQISLGMDDLEDHVVVVVPTAGGDEPIACGEV